MINGTKIVITISALLDKARIIVCDIGRMVIYLKIIFYFDICYLALVTSLPLTFILGVDR